MSMVLLYTPAEAAAESPHVGPERRSSDPLKRLSRRYNQVCVKAVDPLQVAAALEADGVNDAVAAQYGMANVFDLAEELYHRVPLRLTKASPPFLHRRRRWRELSHGPLFALPGLFYPAVVSLTAVPAATLSLALAVIIGWAWSQVMVRLAYLLIGRGLEREAAQLLRTTALIGMITVALLALTGFWSLGSATFLAIGQMAYQMAAATLIMYERETHLFAAMLPGALANLAFLIAPTVVSAATATVFIALSLSLVLAATARATGVGSAPLAPNLGVTRQDLSNALPFMLYGALCALFVSFDTLRFWSWIGSTGLGLSIAPLVISMGVLEWQLRRFRENVAVLLARTHDSQVFSNGVGELFLSALAYYGLVLAGLSAALFSLHGLLEIDVWRLGLLLMANWLLGCAFFVGFALISQNRIGLVITYLLIALGVHALDVGLTFPWQDDYATSYWLSCLIFAVLLLAISKSVLSEIRNYRYDLEATGYGQA